MLSVEAARIDLSGGGGVVGSTRLVDQLLPACRKLSQVSR